MGRRCAPLLLLSVLAGCSWLDQTFPDKSQDYKRAEPTQSLEIPPDLTSTPTTDALVVPSGPATLSGYTSLESLKNQINDNIAGVSATILNDGSETGAYKLILTGDEAGSEGAFTYDSGERAAEKLLSSPDRPTAIFAANDEMAFGVMNVADRMGIRVPEDLSVVGFDGTAFSKFVIPSLSTIQRQPQEMARLGTQKLIALINEGEDAARAYETMVSPRFVSRESTGPAPNT